MSVHQAVFEDFQSRIQQGIWLPGSRIPSNAQLAKDLGVSPSSIREALRSLETIHMVRIEHGSGVYVTGTRPHVDLSAHLPLSGEQDPLALAEARRVLEPELAALAAERATDDELAAIAQLADQMESAALRQDDFSDLDVLFHNCIARASHSPILVRTLLDVREWQLNLRRAVEMGNNLSKRAARHHLLIAKALLARDAVEVRTLMLGEMNAMVADVVAHQKKLDKVTQVGG